MLSPGEADRRAVGRRPGRLPGRQLPRAVVGVERHLPRHDARLLARRGPRRRVRPAPAGSSDLYQDDGRHPFASINFITAHDGFTLRDLVSYNSKHNEANKEDNRDGTDDNRSWNCGAEGPTDDPEILALRSRQQRNFLATLLLSQGTPMLLGGDEFGRTQGGNNNGWCQDSEVSWFDWSLLETNEELLEFSRKLIALRRAHAVFRRRQFLFGREIEGSGPARRGLVRHGRRADARRGLGRLAAGRRRVPQRRGDRLAGLARAPGARRVVPAAVQRAPRGPRVHAPRGGVRQGLDRGVRHGRRRRRARSIRAGDEVDLVHHSLVLLRRVSE